MSRMLGCYEAEEALEFRALRNSPTTASYGVCRRHPGELHADCTQLLPACLLEITRLDKAELAHIEMPAQGGQNEAAAGGGPPVPDPGIG